MRATKIKKLLTDYVKIKDYVPQLIELSNDKTIPKYATNLVYLSTAKRTDEIEQKMLFSILESRPKRADNYFFVTIEYTDDPYTMDYKVTQIAQNDVIRVRFRLGFKVQNRLHLYMRHVIEELVKKKELLQIDHHYHSVDDYNICGDIRVVLVEDVLSYENELPFWEKVIMDTYMSIKSYTTTPVKWFGLDPNAVTEEKAPLVIRKASNIKLRRIYEEPVVLD